MPAPARATLLVPRARRPRGVDVASREPFIARQRHPARRWRRLRRAARSAGVLLVTVLALAALAVTGAAVAHAVRTTPLLAVRHVLVEGARRVPEAAVRAGARIDAGTNLLALDVDSVVERLESLPGVRRARVVRELPDRVRLVLEEREPYTLVNVAGAGGGLFWVDADGYLVGRERHPSAPALPILSGVELPADGGDHPVGDRLYAGLMLLRALQRAGGRVVRRVSEVDVDHAAGPVLYTVDGIQVWVGREAWEERLARLDGVLGDLEEQGEAVESVDLRYRDLVVWRPRATMSAVGTMGTAGTGEPGPQKER